MKSTREDRETQPKYPYLGINPNNDYIVLFSKQQCGVIIYSNTSTRYIGYYSDEWFEHNFTLYKGMVELENE